MKSLNQFRRDRYKFTYSNYPYLRNWKKNPYRWFKTKVYVELSALLVYLLVKTRISPNAVTTTYAVMGILGGIFLAIPMKLFIILAILLFYFRGVLDWADGLLAREKKLTSITGDILDNYGALTGWVCLWVGLGLYVANKSFVGITYIPPTITSFTTVLFEKIIYIIPIIPAIFAMNLLVLAKYRLYDFHITQEIQRYTQKKNDKEEISVSLPSLKDPNQFPTLKKIMLFIEGIFRHNARTVDFICFILLFELIFPLFISWIIFFAFLLCQIVIFSGVFAMVARGGWAERDLENKLKEIYKIQQEK